jgi:transposase
MRAAESEIRRKRRVLEHAAENGNVAKTCRYFGVPRTSFYRWRKAYQEHGEEGLRCKKSIAKSHPNQTPDEIVEKILHLRQKYHLGPVRIMWYMARYHQMRVSDATIYRVLKRHGVNRLPGKVGRRKVHTKRYNKRVPGHHIQLDVKFLIFRNKSGKRIKRYQYTAIDDATRVRALKIYTRHTQKNAIAFVDHIVPSFLFVSSKSGPIVVMNSRRSSTGTSRTWVSGMRISNRERLSSTARSNAGTAPIRKSSINY